MGISHRTGQLLLALGLLTGAVLPERCLAIALVSPQDSLGAHPCYWQAAATLNSWSPNYQWHKENDEKEYAKVYSSKLDELHTTVWIGQAGASLHARKLSSESKLTVKWTAPACTPEVNILAEYRSRPNLFDDWDLDALLKKNRKGIILTFSPQMHLSIEARSILDKLSKELGLPLLSLQDPESELIQGLGLGSAQLIRAGMSLHYPCLVVYKNGAVVGNPWPGLKSPDEYRQFIQKQLK